MAFYESINCFYSPFFSKNTKARIKITARTAMTGQEVDADHSHQDGG
jgi:hypothetical protein